MRRSCAAVCGMRTDMMASQALGRGDQVRHRADAADARHQAGHLVERTAFGKLLEAAHLRDVEVRVFHLALAVQLDRDLAVPFQAGYGIDRDGLAHDQAPKRVSAGTSSGPPVNSAVSAAWKVSAEGGHPGRNTSTVTNS